VYRAVVATIDRSRIAIGLEPEVRDRLRTLAAGRILGIDFFSARCCTSVLIGDLTARWLVPPLPGGFVVLMPIEGVDVAADERLLDLLEHAGPTLTWGGPPFARHFALRLADPAAWLTFLETPAAFRAHRHSLPAESRPSR